MATTTRREAIRKRHRRVRKTVLGTAERPRLAVYRSNRHIYAQLIDDLAGRTLASASPLPVVSVEEDASVLPATSSMSCA